MHPCLLSSLPTPPPFPPPFRRRPSNAPPGSVFSLSSLRHRPLPGIAPLSPVSSPFPPSSAPFLHSPAHALPAPQHRLSLGAPSTPRYQPSSAPSAPLPSGTVQPNKPNGGPPFRLVWPNGGPPFGQIGLFRTKVLCSAIFGRTEALGSAKQDRTETLRSVLFGRTVLKGRGVLGADAEKSRRGAGREHVPKSGKRVLGKREGSGAEEEGGDEGGIGRGRRRERGCGEKKGG